MGELYKSKSTSVIIGMHGKTTVTSMLSKIFIDADREPNILIGSQASFLPLGNAYIGKGDDFIVEGDEYQRQ